MKEASKDGNQTSLRYDVRAFAAQFWMTLKAVNSR